MIFTERAYLVFFVVLFAAYWLVRRRTPQNLILLAGSYLFYGWVHPWFCLLIAASTVLDYGCGLGMWRWPARRRLFLILSLAGNLGMLGVFKYFNFFVDNVYAVTRALGLAMDPVVLRIFLPVGISFYTFQTLSYTLDIYAGKLEPRRSFLDFAVFVSLFPQLVAGPIERAVHLLPQIERPRRWDWSWLRAAVPLLILGYLKKMVIADNVAVYADQVYALQHPPLPLLLVGTVAFAVQIYADFSAYTDIARGSAKLLGFDLMENFNSPYLAISPSDFWRRWHISFSSWVRDYLYIPLGGSRAPTARGFAWAVMLSMGLSGLWHGAAWNFVLWGLYCGALVFLYHRLGMGGRWRPTGVPRTALAWLVMMAFTLFGWMLFRASGHSGIAWLANALAHPWAGDFDVRLATATVAALVALYTLPLAVAGVVERFAARNPWAHACFHGFALASILLFARLGRHDFIYFAF